MAQSSLIVTPGLTASRGASEWVAMSFMVGKSSREEKTTVS